MKLFSGALRTFHVEGSTWCWKISLLQWLHAALIELRKSTFDMLSYFQEFQFIFLLLW